MMTFNVAAGFVLGLIALSNFSDAAQGQRCHLVGRIGSGKLKTENGSITSADAKTRMADMVLRLEGNKVTGDYYYSQGGTHIQLKGQLNTQGLFEIAEDSTEGKTGIFRVKLAEDCQKLVGEWEPLPISPNATKLEVEFLRDKASEVMVSNSLFLVKRATFEHIEYFESCHDINDNSYCSVEAEDCKCDPKGAQEKINSQLVEAYDERGRLDSINTGIKRTADELCNPLTCISMDTSIGLTGPDLISINFSSYGSTNWAFGFNQYQSRTWKIFKPKSEAPYSKAVLPSWLKKEARVYLQKIARAILKSKRPKNVEPPITDAQWKKAIGAFQLNLDHIGLAEKGLEVSAFYNSYGDIEPNGHGNNAIFIEIVILYQEIKSIIKPNTPLAELIR